jgi:oligosaccharyltransferase complex subunit beta
MQFALWALLLCGTAVASQEFSQNALVLLDDPLTRHTHSIYFSDLASRGFNLNYKAVGDRNLQLRDWDDWLYDHLIIFAPSATGERMIVSILASMQALTSAHLGCMQRACREVSRSV